MMLENKTQVTEFIFIGFSQSLQIRFFHFFLTSTFYFLNIFGNSFVIFIVSVSVKMHTPMYYFLCNLSFIDLCYSSTTIPKMLSGVFSTKRTILVVECLVQINAELFFGGTECMLLAVMAYDRYIAICFPLYYTIIINRKVCTKITVILWVGNFMLSTIPMISKPLVFCGENKVDHVVCELMTIVGLACGDISSQLTNLFFTVLKIRSAVGRSRAFSTCASHLTVVCMFYGAIITLYMTPKNTFKSNQKYIAFLNGAAAPALNPLIYTLRNNDVKEAWKTFFKRFLKLR
ncbi:hypothetical protein GDO78_020925 [Eleutherodactylus coqui]|uniref:G-protein coupled receptors family 1 profile domain-containing protein n=1 Tax=Eleutherodactylus coqui TaxID=57060 RepID=A0A8J6JT16_ELECQ|nr:hypothetical protein GDO78_020925 [Eleutherodactylus coqui]